MAAFSEFRIGCWSVMSKSQDIRKYKKFYPNIPHIEIIIIIKNNLHFNQTPFKPHLSNNILRDNFTGNTFKSMDGYSHQSN